MVNVIYKIETDAPIHKVNILLKKTRGYDKKGGFNDVYDSKFDCPIMTWNDLVVNVYSSRKGNSSTKTEIRADLESCVKNRRDYLVGFRYAMGGGFGRDYVEEKNKREEEIKKLDAGDWYKVHDLLRKGFLKIKEELSSHKGFFSTENYQADLSTTFED